MIKTDLFEEVIRDEIGRGCFVVNNSNTWVRFEAQSRWTFEVEYDEDTGEFLFFSEDSVLSAESEGSCFADSSEAAVEDFREFLQELES